MSSTTDVPVPDVTGPAGGRATGRLALLCQPRPRLMPWAMLVLMVAYLGASYSVANSNVYWQSVIPTAAVFAVLAVSLDLVAGVTGLYSLGHAGLFALGAYTTTLLNQHGWNVFVLLPVSIVGVGLVGAILGSVSLRVSGLYFAIITFIFTLVVTVLASDLHFTGGLQGMIGPSFPDFPDSLSSLGSSLVWCISLVLLLTLVVVWSIRSSPLYPVLLAIRDAEPFAASAGVRTWVMKVGVFGLSAALAGMAGWAFSFLGFVSPGQFSWTVSVNILVMVILGGMNTRLGPLLGAAFVSAFPVVVSIDPFIQEVIFGCIFVLVIVFFPTGIMGILTMAGKRIARIGQAPSQAGAASAASSTVDTTGVAGDRPTVVTPALGDTPAPGAAPTAGAAGATDHALVARGIFFRYPNGTPAVSGVDITVRRGTIHGLIGPNGSGKSTLVNLISGQLRPDAGTIEINGHLMHRSRAASRPHSGLMRTFQTPVLVKELSTRENVTIGLYSTVRGIAGRSLLWPLLPGSGHTRRRMRESAVTALRDTGLHDVWTRARVADVPHGVEQLTQLAAACVGRPSILVLDEPLAGLSVGEVEQVSHVLRELRAAGVTVIVIEHQTRFIFDMCEDVTVLAAGQLVVSGPAAEVRSNDRVREVYLGQ